MVPEPASETEARPRGTQGRRGGRQGGRQRAVDGGPRPIGRADAGERAAAGSGVDDRQEGLDQAGSHRTMTFHDFIYFFFNIKS